MFKKIQQQKNRTFPQNHGCFKGVCRRWLEALSFIPFSDPAALHKVMEPKVLTIKSNTIDAKHWKVWNLLSANFRTNITVHGGALVVIGILILILQMTKTILKLEKIQYIGCIRSFWIGLFNCLLLRPASVLSWNLGPFPRNVLIILSISLSHTTLGLAGWVHLINHGSFL